MKEYDKNSLIGFVLMAIILIVFNTFFFPEVNPEKDTSNKSIITEPTNQEKINNDLINNELDNPNLNDKTKQVYGSFARSVIEKETFHSIENEKIKITISNKGGRIISAIMKEYQTFDSLPLDLFYADSSRFNLQFITGEIINTENRFFIAEEGSNSLNMRLNIAKNQYIEYVYTIIDDYLIDFDVNIVGMEDVIPAELNYLNLEWQMQTPQTEKSKTNQDMYTGIQYQYKSDNEVDYLSFSSNDDDKIDSRLNWVAFKQQFFLRCFDTTCNDKCP